MCLQTMRHSIINYLFITNPLMRAYVELVVVVRLPFTTTGLLLMVPFFLLLVCKQTITS